MMVWSHTIKHSENAVMLQPTFPVSSIELFVKRMPTPLTPTPRRARPPCSRWTRMTNLQAGEVSETRIQAKPSWLK